VCFDTNARPPLPPVSGGAARGRLTTLRSDDGTEFAAFAAATDKSGSPGVVILPDVRGLYGYYHDLANRFAEAGSHAVAIDYFGRTAGVGTRDDEFDFWSHVQQCKPHEVSQDVAAAIAYLRSEEGIDSIFTVGFCFGGRASFNESAQGHGLAGVIGFYGRVGQRDDKDTDAPILRASDYKAPVLGLFGGADQGIPTDDVEKFGMALDEAGIDNEIMIYEGAPHSFFDRAFEQFKEECDDAWRRVLAFIAKHSASKD
jgi:carboxymethylenebutenolidase